jgi:hypothetical protein
LGATATITSNDGLLDGVQIISPGSGFAVGDIVQVTEDGGQGIGHFLVETII